MKQEKEWELIKDTWLVQKYMASHDSLISILEQNMNNIMVGCKVHTKEFKSIHVTIESNLHTYHNNDE